MKSIPEIFGSEVRRRREKMGVSQEAFAEIAGIHRTYVSGIELGKVSISIDVAQKLADALKTPLSTIWRAIEKKRASSQP